MLHRNSRSLPVVQQQSPSWFDDPMAQDSFNYDENMGFWDGDLHLFEDNVPGQPDRVTPPAIPPLTTQLPRAFDDLSTTDYFGSSDNMLLTPTSEVETPIRYTSEGPSSPDSTKPQPTRTQKTSKRGKKSDSSDRRTSHTEVERRYRDTLNDGLERLKRTLALGQASDDGEPEYASSRRIPKAVVLSTAVHRIRTLEKERGRLAEQNALLIAEVRRLRGGGAGIPVFLGRPD